MKELYSIAELKKMGYPEKTLREISRSGYFPIVGIRSYPRGKCLFNKQKLDEFLERRTARWARESSS